VRVRVGTCRTRLRYDSDKNTNSLRRWAHLILGTQNQTTTSHPLLHTPTASARPKNNSTQAITIHKLSRGEACTSNLVFRRMATSFFLAPRIPYRIPAFWATKNSNGRSRTRDSSWPPRIPTTPMLRHLPHRLIPLHQLALAIKGDLQSKHVAHELREAAGCTHLVDLCVSTGQILAWRPRKVGKGALLDKLSRAQADSSVLSCPFSPRWSRDCRQAV